MTQDDGPEPVGSLAEEAAKLFGVVSGWAREHGDGGPGTAGAVADGLREHLATGAAECSWCPVCRTVAAVRQTSPEVRAHLVSAASSLLLAVSGMTTARAASPAAGVERIDLDDDRAEDDR